MMFGLFFVLLATAATIGGFVVPSSTPRMSPLRAPRSTTGIFASSHRASASSSSSSLDSFLWNEFKTASGEVLNPYQVLQVKRSCDISDIKQAYRELSRRYHPDAASRRRFLPGKCNNEDDVRDEWERIKLSYEILRSPKLRKKYDRSEAISDPAAAVRRAAVGAAWDGLSSVGKGLFDVTASAMQGAVQGVQDEMSKQKRKQQLEQKKQQRQKQREEKENEKRIRQLELNLQVEQQDQKQQELSPIDQQPERQQPLQQPVHFDSSDIETLERHPAATEAQANKLQTELLP